MLQKITLFVALCGICPLLYGQTDEERNPFTIEGSYVGDGYYNASGGLATGGGFMGMGNITIGFDTEQAGWWKGGNFFINGASIHGKSLSENYLGDIQVASNIDAGNHNYLHELWFKQQIGRVSFTIGLQDLNAEFMVSENAGWFINSSFGVPPVVSTNVPVPIFPLTGLGISVSWDINDRWRWQAAIFDGDQTGFDRNPYNINWNMREEDGLLAMTEFHLNGQYKIGAYYHSLGDNYGFYFMGDETILEWGNHRLDLFGQIAIAPKDNNDTNYSIAAGLNLFGVFSSEDRDAIGFAATHAGMHSPPHKYETSLELYYKYQFNDKIALQPNIQYIINPSGTGTALKNALVCMIRLHINF